MFCESLGYDPKSEVVISLRNIGTCNVYIEMIFLRLMKKAKKNVKMVSIKKISTTNLLAVTLDATYLGKNTSDIIIY